MKKISNKIKALLAFNCAAKEQLQLENANLVFLKSSLLIWVMEKSILNK